MIEPVKKDDGLVVGYTYAPEEEPLGEQPPICGPLLQAAHTPRLVATIRVDNALVWVYSDGTTGKTVPEQQDRR